MQSSHHADQYAGAGGRASAGEEMPAGPPPEAQHGDPADRQPAHLVLHHEPGQLAEGRDPRPLAMGQPPHYHEARRGEHEQTDDDDAAHRRSNPQKAVSHRKYATARARYPSSTGSASSDRVG